MKKLLLTTAFVCMLAAPASAQVESLFFQGPWNQNAQHRTYKAVRSEVPQGMPPVNKRCGWYMGKLTGHVRRSLWKAANWAREFPRTHASPGAVVVWPHHVARIVSLQGNCRAIVHDNAGTYSRNICGAVYVRV